MKTYGGMWSSVVSFMPQFAAGETAPRYPMDRRLGRPQSRSVRCGEERNLLPLPGIEPQSVGGPARSSSN
jgi:hypothetical protein